MQVKITVSFDDQGRATIRVGDKKAMKMDALKSAEFTMKLAKSMGQIIERHRGEHQAELDAKNDVKLYEQE